MHFLLVADNILLPSFFLSFFCDHVFSFVVHLDDNRVCSRQTFTKQTVASTGIADSYIPLCLAAWH